MTFLRSKPVMLALLLTLLPAVAHAQSRQPAPQPQRPAPPLILPSQLPPLFNPWLKPSQPAPRPSPKGQNPAPAPRPAPAPKPTPQFKLPPLRLPGLLPPVQPQPAPKTQPQPAPKPQAKKPPVWVLPSKLPFPVLRPSR